MRNEIKVSDLLENILVSDEILIRYNDLQNKNIHCEIVALSEVGHTRLDLEEYLLYKDNPLFSFDLYGSNYQPICEGK